MTGAAGNVPEKVPENAKILVRSILKFRAQRRAVFGTALFGEPAWEILLELYAAELAGRRESVSSLCIASAVPATTALRCLRLLEEGVWIRRHNDPADRRRYFVELSEPGREAMQRVFSMPLISPE